MGSVNTRDEGDLLLSVRDLEVVFDTEAGVVHAVNQVSFDVRRGEVLAVVGESGSGKSVTMMSLIGLLPSPPARIVAGQALWKGRDLLSMSHKEMRKVRGKEIGMIFQDPLSSLNPTHRIGRQVAEGLRLHEGMSARAAGRRAVELLDLVGIPQPDQRAHMYPHEFSGGMRQRAMIALAIACQPDLLIADEPTTALDVTVQAQVLEVLINIKDELNSAIVLITHDLGVVAGLAHEMLVMYAGRVAESGTADEVYYRTAHPYTQGLLASLPRVDQNRDHELTPIGGAPPSLLNMPPGCAFHPRCPHAEVPGRCDTERPMLEPIDGSHASACHLTARLARGNEVAT